MTSGTLIAARLDELADQEFQHVKTWIDQFQFPQHITLLIELCRVMDYLHVLQSFSRSPEPKIPIPDLTIMLLGWNPALGLLLPHAGGFNGVPLAESTTDSRAIATSLLHQLGRFSLLKRTAQMIRHGMAEGELEGGRIVLRASDRVSNNHLVDDLDAIKFQHLSSHMHDFDPVHMFINETRVEDLQARLQALVFPWKTGQGTMIGYHAAPDIDEHFQALVIRKTAEWRNQTGIHPSITIGEVSAADLFEIGLLLTSFNLKHICFVNAGIRIMPEANYPMSLTIWKRKSELTNSIAQVTGIETEKISAILDLLAVNHSHSDYFQTELTPFIPMLIEICDGYLLSPVSSIFRNPFEGIRILAERRSNQAQASIRKPRESWMVSELCNLFLGNRYAIVDHPTRLRRNRNTVTDIDAAVLDRTTGELGLFQLKWQDFSINEIKQARSKAKNFVDQVDSWAQKTGLWVNEFGTNALCKTLRLKLPAREQISAVRLFAMGRSASRFQSYGYTTTSKNLAVCTWSQFVRLRYEVGPAVNVLQSLHERVQSEYTLPTNNKPLPHEITAAGQKILLDNFWNLYDDDEPHVADGHQTFDS